MDNVSFFPWIYKALLLILMVLLYALVPQTTKSLAKKRKDIVTGLYLGLIGILIMMPMPNSPSYIYDAISIFLAISGLYFGLSATLIAMFIVIIFCLSNGREESWLGVLLILSSGCIGIVWGKINNSGLNNISIRELFLFGLIVHIPALALILWLSSTVSMPEFLLQTALPLLVISPIVVALMGGSLSKLLRNQLALGKQLEDGVLFQSQFNLIDVGVTVTLPNNFLLRGNQKLTAILGYSETELKKLTWMEITHPDDLERELIEFNKVLSSEIDCYEIGKRFIHKNGSSIDLHTTVSCYRNEGQVEFFITTLLDATKRIQHKENVSLLATVFNNALEAITITDAYGTIIDVNDTFMQMTGYSREEAIGQNSRSFQSGRNSKNFYEEMWHALLKKGFWGGEVVNLRKSGEFYTEMKKISAVRNEDGKTTHYVALCSDVTQMREHETQLKRSAQYDTLTGLPNRSLLADRLNMAIINCKQHGGVLAVVFLDLDDFKVVNDTYGHDVGDSLLISFSRRMKNVLRAGDTLSHFGGDEFVAILTDLTKFEDCLPVLERLLHKTVTSIKVDGHLIELSASIGVTIYPQDNVDAEQLIRHADQAMYSAKQSGKKHFQLFDTKIDKAINARQQNLADIQSAIDNNEFVLYYQPKVNMLSGEVHGVEALIRRQHPMRGLLPPSEFLPIIENHPISLDVGEWVIDTALQQISTWQEEGLNIAVSVNISAYQLQQNGFVHRLEALLSDHSAISPSNLELEVLETSALDDVENVSDIMESCIRLGVSFAIDDFGTGYSSLTYLRRLPTRIIKIDQSFVRDILQDPDDLSIVEGVIGLAKSFKLGVIAEGVETVEHGAKLVRIGCEMAQGYGIARPMPAEQVLDWSKNWKPDSSWNLK